MPLTYLDFIVAGVMLVSALLAMVRGFTREVLTIVAWLVAGVAALSLRNYVVPYVTPYIKDDMSAQIVSGGIVFLVVLIIVSLITIRISDMIIDSRIGAIDRTLGFIFGAARGLLLCVIAFVFFNYLVPENSQPDWVKNAKTQPVLAIGSSWVLKFVPNIPLPPAGTGTPTTVTPPGEAQPATPQPENQKPAGQ